jgi:hypothetical protein
MKTVWKWTIAVVVLSAICVVAVRHFLWIRAYQARVTCAGRQSETARVYVNHRKGVLVTLREPGRGAYLIDTRDELVGVPMEGFWLKTGLLVGVDAKSIAWMTARTARNYDPKLRIAGNSAAFTSVESEVIGVAW